MQTTILDPPSADVDSAEVRRQAIAAARGLALAAVYGLAIGARYGMASMAVHAVGVPLGLLAALGMTAPAAAIGVAHLDLPVDLRGLARGAAHAVETAGVVLAALAPGMLLATVTCETAAAAAVLSSVGLALGSGLGARRLWQAVGDTPPGDLGGALAARGLLLLLSTIAALIAVRAWWLVLPLLGGPLSGATP